MTSFVRSATTGSSSPQEKPRTDTEILTHLQDIQIQIAFINTFGKEEGQKYFNIYKEKEPAPLIGIKDGKTVRINIPNAFITDKTDLTANAVLHFRDGKTAYQVNFKFTENSKGELEIGQTYECLTRKKLLEQKWLQNYKEEKMQKDGDLSGTKFAIDLHQSAFFKTAPVAEIKDTPLSKVNVSQSTPDAPTIKDAPKEEKPSYWQRLVIKVISSVKPIFAFFQTLLQRILKTMTSVNSPTEPQEKIILSEPDKNSISEEEEEEDEGYLNFF